MPRTTSITLGSHQQQFIDALVQSGRYTSTSEVIRDALRKLEEAQGPEWLLAQLLEGEKGAAREWNDQDLVKHIKQEAKTRGYL